MKKKLNTLSTRVLKISRYRHMQFAAMTHLAEGLCLDALLTLKADQFSCLVGTRVYQQRPRWNG